MTKQTEAMKLALEAITTYLSESPDPSEEAVEGLCDAASILKKALAEQPAQQEPVAWYRDEDGIRIYYESKVWDDATPLYTSPPAQQEPVALQEKFSLLLWDYQELERAFEKITGGKWIRKSNTPQRTSPPAQRKPLTDEQIKAMIPSADGSAEANKRRVEVLPGVMGTEFDEVDAWSMPLVLQIARAVEAAHGIKGDA